MNILMIAVNLNTIPRICRSANSWSCQEAHPIENTTRSDFGSARIAAQAREKREGGPDAIGSHFASGVETTAGCGTNPLIVFNTPNSSCDEQSRQHSSNGPSFPYNLQFLVIRPRNGTFSELMPHKKLGVPEVGKLAQHSLVRFSRQIG
jgi:hypothetical protein